MNSSLSENMTNISATEIIFSWLDYTFFISTLALSTLIGVYFGCFGRKQSTTNEYLMGNTSMKPLTIAMSLIASHISGASLIMIPAETYRYGAFYFLDVFAIIFQNVLNVCIYLPVYFGIEITSIYEYLERRFDKRARLLASFLFFLSSFLYLPFIVYSAALVCSVATGLNIHLITAILCCVCIFYTSISGLKGVIWTDALQFVIMMGTMTFIFVLSIKSSGGLSTVWNKAVKGQRLDIFNLDFDPTIRLSIWTFILGHGATRLALNCASQSTTQKFMTLSTFRDGIYCVIYYTTGLCFVTVAIIFFGLAMYAKYSDCDLLESKILSKSDQLVPHFVLDVGSHVPGVPGLFTAGIVSASLSSLSVGWNAIAGTVYLDFLKNRLNRNISEKTGTNILKMLVVIQGILSMCMVYIIHHLNEMFPLLLSFMALTYGPLLGIFSLGVLFPKANSKGAFYGTLIGLISGASIIFPSKYFHYRGWIKYTPRPVSTESCQFLNNSITNLSNETITVPSIPFVFKISFMYHALIGAVLTIIVGLVISYLTKQNEMPIDRILISPVSRFLLAKETQSLDKVEYKSVKEDEEEKHRLKESSF